MCDLGDLIQCAICAACLALCCSCANDASSSRNRSQQPHATVIQGPPIYVQPQPGGYPAQPYAAGPYYGPPPHGPYSQPYPPANPHPHHQTYDPPPPYFQNQIPGYPTQHNTGPYPQQAPYNPNATGFK